MPTKRLVAVVMAAALPACDLARRGGEAPAAPASAALDRLAERSAASAEQQVRALGYVAKAQGAGAVATSAAASPPPGSPASEGLAAALAARKLIRTAQLTIQVQKYGAAAEEVAKLAETFGGYVAEAQATRGQQDRQAGTITIRVPAGRFGEALAALKGMGTVRSEHVGTQDVTKAYADLETRLRVKRDTADRLRELLRTRTADLGDVLNAERELARVTEEIEQMEGERRFYDAQVALSTITLSLHEPQALVEPGVFAPIGQALRDSAEVLARSIAGLIYAAVFLAPWLLLAWVLWRTVRFVRARRKTPAARAEA